MHVVIHHDPYARQSTVRSIITPGHACKECGQPARFRYGVEADDSLRGLVRWIRGAFCSVGCFRAYHGFGA